MSVYRYRMEKLERRQLLAGSPLDVSFDYDGVATTDFDTYFESFTQVVAAKGTFGTATVTAGGIGGKFLVARFKADGLLDPTLNGGTGWKLVPFITGSAATALAVQNDGKILLGGTYYPSGGGAQQAVVIRLTAAGDYDSTWDGDGIWSQSLTGGQTSSVCGLKVASDGSVYLAGDDLANFIVARFTSTGTLDNTFGTFGTGKVTFPAPNAGTRPELEDFAVSFAPGAAGPNTRLLVGGTYLRPVGASSVRTGFVASLNLNGTLDAAFGAGGIADVVTPGDFFVTEITADAAGRVLVGGAMFQRSTVARLTPSGAMDASFGGGDGVYDHTASLLYTVGGLAVSGSTILFSSPIVTSINGSHIVALTDAGVVDTTFANNGVLSGGLGAFADADVQSDGKIVFAGTVFRSNDQRDTQVARITFAAQTAGSIQGTLFVDTDGNGVQDTTESLYTGFGISAYLDLDQNGSYSTNEPTFYTGNTGRYAFGNLLPGSYVVRLSIPGTIDYRQTVPANNAGISVNVVAGQSATASPFALRQAHSIPGVVFNDANEDGVRNDTTAEPGIAGRTVYVDLNANNAPDAGEPTATTSSSGGYSFKLTPGSYFLRQVLPAGWAETGRSGYFAPSSQFTATGVVKVPDDVVTAATPSFNFGSRQLPTTPPVVTTVTSGTAAYVRDGSYAATNFGADPTLVAKWSVTLGNTRQMYVKFDLTAVPAGSAIAAKVRIYGKLSATGSVPISIRGTPTGWSESTLTWNNRPAAGATALAAATVTSTTSNWFELDVTAYVQSELAAGRKIVSFVVGATSKTDAQAIFNSDDATSNRPQIQVTTSSQAQQGIFVSPSSISVPEASKTGFNVSLATAPAANVTVTISRQSGDTDLTSDKATLTFTPVNWNLPQPVYISAAADADTGNGQATFAVSSTGLTTRSVVATEIDDDAPVQPRTITSTVAAFVRDGAYAGQNFNADPTLAVKYDGFTGNARETYIKFDLSTVSSIATAKLRLNGKLADTRDAAVGISVFSAADTAWSESVLTWNNKPPAGPTLRGSLTVAGTTSQWYEVNLASFLQAEFAAGRKVITFVLKTTTTNNSPVTFASDETANGPQIVVT